MVNNISNENTYYIKKNKKTKTKCIRSTFNSLQSEQSLHCVTYFPHFDYLCKDAVYDEMVIVHNDFQTAVY